MPSLDGLSYEQVIAALDRECQEMRTFNEGRAQAERDRAERRREQLILRGQARAVRGRLYDMIQNGRSPT